MHQVPSASFGTEVPSWSSFVQAVVGGVGEVGVVVIAGHWGQVVVVAGFVGSRSRFPSVVIGVIVRHVVKLRALPG